jgi:adenine-specific DNA-methyltransferase
LRYIGNKTKLLPFIGELLDRKRIQPVRAFDAFSGTAAVGRFLKARSASVVSCDLMQFSYAFQRAYIVADAYPRFSALADDPDVRRVRVRADFKARVEQRVGARMAAAAAAAATTAPPSATRPMDEVLVYLDSYLEPHRSFISQHFAAPSEVADLRDSSPISNGEGGGTQHYLDSNATLQRMYFTMPVAGRIDAIRERLHGWHEQGMVSDDEFFLLLAALLEAADAVANTAGIYAAYIKQWQPNALRDLRLRVPWIVSRAHRPGVRSNRPCEAYRGDVSEIAPRAGRFDLLYLDPPYNTRQYSG